MAGMVPLLFCFISERMTRSYQSIEIAKRFEVLLKSETGQLVNFFEMAHRSKPRIDLVILQISLSRCLFGKINR